MRDMARAPVPAFLAPQPVGPFPRRPSTRPVAASRPRCPAPAASPCHGRRVAAATRSVPAASAGADASGARAGPAPPTVLYFAYGSNLSPRALGPNARMGARRVHLRSGPRRGVLRRHLFAYFPTGLPGEPAVATVLPSDRDADVVHGVLYEMSPPAFDSVARSEGVLPRFVPRPPLLPIASIITVRVKVYAEDAAASADAAGEWVLAKTFYWPAAAPLTALLPGASPSARYHGLIADGFRHFSLDQQHMPGRRSGAGAGEISTVFNPDDGTSPSSPAAALAAAAVDEASSAFASDSARAQSLSPASADVRLVNLTPPRSADAPPRPMLAFIPGIDGSGFSIISQLPNLIEAGQDVWATRIPFENRDSWRELGANVLAAVAEAAQRTGAPSVVVLGESMGGAIALQVGLENGRRSAPHVVIDQLVMVNPASSFRRSELSRVWIELTSRVPPGAYNQLVGPALVPFILDPTSIPLAELASTGVRRLSKLRSFLDRAADLLPQAAVAHRLALLNTFHLSPAEYALVANGASRTRLLVAENDNLLPVVADSARLLRLIPGLQRAVFTYGGHAMLQDSRVSLGHLLFQGGAAARGAVATDGLDVEAASPLRSRVLGARWTAPDRDLLLPPTTTERLALARKFRRTRVAHAPVVVGTERLPAATASRPVLFISNHTLLGAVDAVLLMQHVLEHRNTLVRSLAHPLLFRAFDMSRGRSGAGGEAEEGGRTIRLPGLDPVSPDELKRFGIMPISPRALVRELANNHWVLLFPGGAREALKRRSDEKYSLHWPETSEFVRVAAAMGATIVPVSTVGQEDSVSLLLDSAQVTRGVRALSKLPGMRFGAGAQDARVPVARQWRGAAAGEEKDFLLPPLAVPSAPDRVYLRFGEPMVVPAAAEGNRALAGEIYEQVKAAVGDGVNLLLERREMDEYRSPAARLAFRMKHGGGVEPPTSPAWTWETRAGPIDD